VEIVDREIWAGSAAMMNNDEIRLIRDISLVK